MSKIAFDSSRRAIVFGCATVATLTAAGGCSIVPKPKIAEACNPRPSPFLAGPEVLAAWAKPERYFDAHTHFFNAQDVPVAAFLTKSVAHSIPSPRLRDLVTALAPVAEALAQLAPTPASEHKTLCSRAGLKTLSLPYDNEQFDDDIDKARDVIADEIYREILKRGDQITRLVNEAISSAKASKSSALLNQTQTFSLNFVREALRDGGSVRDQSSNKLKIQRAADLNVEEALVAAMKGVLQFVGFMLAPRHHNLRTYIRRNAEHSPGLPLSGCFASMVDFNYWLDSPAKASHMEDQIRVHEQLALLSRGFLMPLVGYNPWVDIRENNASLALVEKAIKYHGCVGVKIYPPMGFYPYNNIGLPLQTAEKRPDLAALDKKLAAFYELCDSLSVPVMAHANESNGRDAAHDALAGTVGWTALRDKGPPLRSLYVNAGHFGGSLEHDSGDWSDDFVKLMIQKGTLQVYADLGYWNDLLDSSTVRAKLERELATTLDTGGTVANRVMYGSDWLMLSKEPGWEAYAGGVASIIRKLDLSGALAAKVLGDNAMQCYGLKKDSNRGNLERLLMYYRDNGSAGPPGWL